MKTKNILALTLLTIILLVGNHMSAAQVLVRPGMSKTNIPPSQFAKENLGSGAMTDVLMSKNPFAPSCGQYSITNPTYNAEKTVVTIGFGCVLNHKPFGNDFYFAHKFGEGSFVLQNLSGLKDTVDFEASPGFRIQASYDESDPEKLLLRIVMTAEVEMFNAGKLHIKLVSSTRDSLGKNYLHESKLATYCRDFYEQMPIIKRCHNKPECNVGPCPISGYGECSLSEEDY